MPPINESPTRFAAAVATGAQAALAAAAGVREAHTMASFTPCAPDSHSPKHVQGTTVLGRAVPSFQICTECGFVIAPLQEALSLERERIADEAILLIRAFSRDPSNATAFARLICKIARLAATDLGHMPESRIRFLATALANRFDAMTTEHGGWPLIRAFRKIVDAAEAA